MQLLAVDPALGGMALRARSGPVRDRLMGLLHWLPQPQHRIHPAISDEALFGGLDLSATLATGAFVQEQGLLSRPSTMILTMAERATTQLAARLAMVLDAGSTHRLIALDEGAEPDEALNPKLAERLAFAADLSEVSVTEAILPDAFDPAAAITHLRHVAVPDDLCEQLTRIAAQFGIDSLRAPLFALRAAKAHAALLGKMLVDADDVEIACLLVFAHRATQMPGGEEDDDTPEPDQNDPEDQDQTDIRDLPDELLLDAIKALLPDDLLDRIAAQKARQGKGSGSGAARKGNRRGRPMPSRAGRLGDGARIDIVATLRAAAPWQSIRKQATGRDSLQVRSADIRVKRFEEKSDRLLVFTVDASGSSALSRLAEAKGAIELLLAQAYARRDHVALVAFRGTGAEVLLPPTRSLVQTKRRLAALPGGGGTPLAAGIVAALDQAVTAIRKGLTPTIVILTDGRANIALDGAGNRPQAAADAQRMAQAVRAQGIDALVIDTGNRPEPALAALAQSLGAIYLPMPRADAARLSASVATALGD
ncbi:magnesium chelatase subunit D [Yoonia vestfoldensis]|uniref:Magnesium chelatase ATPase subunit D n=1 Tax=Yoonia vestfoldensis TaxID=245188 RepID=A0A1Y0EHG6_9RHOB|nr:magnesium chelatase subunit D [Yoonia vestfoldensis]ARU02888.1 magnesium chelatase ATPase subunit D [Yoonia vestfoldensis]